MQEIERRKCAACKLPIEFTRNNIRGVAYYKKLYYHTACLCELAEKKLQNKRCNAADWQYALDNMAELESDAKNVLRQHWGDKDAKDELNDYLLSQYNVMAISDARFWQTISDLSNGLYKRKRCKKVSTQTLLEAWKWGQRKLNEVDKRNKMNHRGPENDLQRISYDLAILVNKIPDYLAYKAKQEAEEAERQQRAKEEIKIDYTKIKSSNGNQLSDISDLLDEFL